MEMASARTKARPQKTRRRCPVTRITWPKTMWSFFFLWVYVKDSFYRPYHKMCLSYEEGSLLSSQKSLVRCCSGCGPKWIISLTSAVSQMAEAWSTYEVCQKSRWFLFLSAGRMLTILSAVQMYRFYEMCQGIMNNPV
jgi:hypothetical protein